MSDFEIDPSQNYLEHLPHPLDSFFAPKTVAIIGAKEEELSVGRTLLVNAMEHFKGKIYPVNPKYPSVLGIKCYPRVQDVPDKVDLAVIVTPPSLIPGLVDDCASAKICAVIIISAGFKETGPEGLALEQEVLSRAKRGGIRIIGPNCLGLMNPWIGLNVTFAAGIALKGNVAFISQSGALCTAVLDWSLQEKIGFSAFVSIGSMADVQWSDLIDYLANDPKTSSILIYMETVGDARAFLSAAKRLVFRKPMILIKPGRTKAAAQAAASHTGSLAGADDIFEAAIQRVGIIRVETIGELFDMAGAFSKQPNPQGPNLAIVTNAGGPAVLATDAALIHGAKMAVLDKKTIDQLSEFLPKAWSHGNPVDILGDARADRYAKAVKLVFNSPEADGILVILTPQDMTEATKTAQMLAKELSLGKKPILTSWMGASHVKEGIEVLANAGIPNFAFPDSASKTFASMWKRNLSLSLLYETPLLRDEINEKEALKEKEAALLLKQLAEENRTLLTEEESKKLLFFYGLPVVQTDVAASKEEAVAIAEKMGYPIVLKLHSLTITHKTDVGGVKLNLQNAQMVASAFDEIQSSVAKRVGKEHFQGVSVQKMITLKGYELIVGSIVDPQFGPVILFGTGGELVEVFQDKAIGIPPLTATLAAQMMQKTKIYHALEGVRGKKGIDFARLEQILIRFSRMIVEVPRIKECDINPLIVSPDGMVALDARVVLHDFAIPDEKLPQAAIRPYPVQYISSFLLKSGLHAVFRPMRPEDEPLLVLFHKELSEESVRQRFFGFMALEKRVAHERLVQVCHCDYNQEISLVAEVLDPQIQEKRIIGVLRLYRLFGTKEAELKLIIADRFQHLGLGKKMLQEGLLVAKKESFHAVYVHILEDNKGMIHLCQAQGFQKLNSESAREKVISMVWRLH